MVVRRVLLLAVFICLGLVIAFAVAPESAPPHPPAFFGHGSIIFDDEFNASKLASSKWTNCYPWGDCINVGNEELEWYTPGNVTVHGGELDLVAVRQVVSTRLGRFDYTSGLIQTDGHFSFTYGYSEIEAWLPAGRSLWPAFWLLPADQTFPPEIDVLEAAGDAPNVAAMTVHFGAKRDDQTTYTGPNFTAGWHTFGVDWEPTRITWYIDGIARKSVTNGAEIPAKPMYLILNLAMDGTKPPNSSTRLPSVFRVRYVRVWHH